MHGEKINEYRVLVKTAFNSGAQHPIQTFKF
jgi:hypothetical protein